MRKWSLFVALLVLTGCSEAEQEQQSFVYPSAFAMEVDDFLYELEVNGERFQDAQPTITATLTYIGDAEEIVITHATSPFYFDVTERTTGYTIDYFTELLERSTTLKKNEPLTEHYTETIGYSETDKEAYRQFIQAFRKGDYLAGNYIVHGYARFTIEGVPTGYELDGYIGFRVE